MKNYSNPYQAPKVGQPRKNPPEGMLGLIATEDGWAEIDSNGHIRKILTKDEFDAYKRAEMSQINAELDKKVDMTDGSNLLFSAVDSIKDLTWITSADFNGDALYTTDWNGVECREDPVGEYNSDKKELYFPVEMVFEKPEDYLKIPIEPLTLTKGAYNKNLYFLSLPTDGIHVDEITPVVDFECHLGDYVFIYSDTNPAEKNEYVEITEDITVDYIVIKSRTFPNCLTTGTLNTDTMIVSNLMVCRGYLIAPGAYYGNPYIGYEDGDKNNAIFYDKSTGQAHLNKMPFKDLAGLHNVDNTSDMEKPVSTATQEALDLKADKSNTYTKLEANRIFAQKSDISNVYKFKGSVDTFDEELMTPATYEIIPKGNPTYNGVVVGTYDAENRTVTIDSKKLEGWVDYEVVVPIEEIVVPKGYYSCKWDISIAGMDGYWAGGQYAYKKNNEDIVTTVSIGHYGYHGAGTIELGNLKKYSSVEVELAENPYYDADYQVIATLETGDVYNVLADDMNYAWTGTEWDALGGEHKDLEARESIEQTNTELGKKADKSNVYTKTEVDDKLESLVDNETLNSHLQSVSNPHAVTAEQVGTYSKTEIDTKLNKKANKEDIVSAYRFCGSVEKFEDLPHRYALIPNGVPTHNGVACGTYDEETHTVTVNDELLVEVGVDRIIIPIVPISIKAGKYFTEYVYYGNASIGSLDTYECGAGGSTYVEMPEQTIDRIEIFTPYGEETISGTTNSLGTLDKIVDSWLIYEWSNYPEIPNGAYDNGAVYNVLEDGMNYAWTGTEWDALGGEHRDIEAREQIAEISTELDKKANKSDVVSTYTFKGSVDTFEDLPKCYEFVPCGNPTVDGVEVGTFDAKNRTITLNEPMTLEGYVIRVPIIDVNVDKGSYYISCGECPDLEVLDTSGYSCYMGDPLEVNTKTTITEVYIGCPYGEYEHSDTYKLGRLYKFRVDEDGRGDSIYINNGDVYEVKESGLSYGWTGSTWDALGTSHIDQEARSDIEELQSGLNQVCSLADEADSRSQSNMHDIEEINTQIGDIETTLDSIIEIQNSLIGGDSV